MMQDCVLIILKQNVLVGHSHYMSFNVNKHLWLYSPAALLKKISPYSGCGNRNTFHFGSTIKLSVKLNVNENQKKLCLLHLQLKVRSVTTYSILDDYSRSQNKWRLQVKKLAGLQICRAGKDACQWFETEALMLPPNT